MNFIPRTACAITGKPLEPLYSFEQFPIHMSCVNYPPVRDVIAEMAFGISPDGVIQLTKLIPLDILYEQSHGSGSIGAKWQRHHAQFAEFISRFQPKKVLEIGAGHGILASMFAEKIEWTIIDPDPTAVSSGAVKVIKGFFDESFSLHGQFDTFIHSHFFEHLYEPNKFLSKIYRESPPGTRHIFSLPNFDEWFRNFDLNTLNFEHTILFTGDVLEYLLLTNGFKILKKEMFEDHSVFYATETDKQTECQLPNAYAERKNHFLTKTAELSSLMSQLTTAAKPLFLYGAHIFSQFALGSGLDPKLVIAVLDNDKNKQEQRLYGSGLLVLLPNVLACFEQPTVLLKVGRYKEEISKQLLAINPEVKIIS